MHAGKQSRRGHGPERNTRVRDIWKVPTAGMTLFSMVVSTAIIVGCSPLPRKYLGQAEPGVTLTALRNAPTQYQGKVVILGGTLLAEEERDGRFWLHVRNRPLDTEYRPHLPGDRESTEGGTYWVMVKDRREFPPQYRHWARMTVVGRVAGTTSYTVHDAHEPVLTLLYVRGWGISSSHDGAWEDTTDGNYMLPPPSGTVEGGQQK